MIVLLLTALGALFALVIGVRHLLAADALAAFHLYQAALGVATLLTAGLRGRQRPTLAQLWTPGLWLAALLAAGLLEGPWWTLPAVAMAALLVWQQRPDTALFSAATLPVSLGLILVAWWRGEPFPYGYLALLLSMAALFWWKARAGRPAHHS
jgi:hypothetical protein